MKEFFFLKIGCLKYSHVCHLLQGTKLFAIGDFLLPTTKTKFYVVACLSIYFLSPILQKKMFSTIGCLNIQFFPHVEERKAFNNLVFENFLFYKPFQQKINQYELTFNLEPCEKGGGKC